MGIKMTTPASRIDTLINKEKEVEMKKQMRYNLVNSNIIRLLFLSFKVLSNSLMQSPQIYL